MNSNMDRNDYIARINQNNLNLIMKNLTTLLLAILCSGYISSQSFSDDFESYEVGDFIGVESSEWTTWSGTTGGNEDAAVVSDQSSSGSNSIYFSSTLATGGPQDVVLPFGGEYNIGDFHYEMDIYVEDGQGAYFNFQANETIGQIWALDAYFVQDGSLIISNQGNQQILTDYESNEWLTISFDINLTTNVWTASLNGVLLGSFTNAENQLASIDIFPVNQEGVGGNNLSSFWVDNVSYEYIPYELQAINLGVISNSLVGAQGLAGQNKNISSVFRNLGTEEITSFDVEVTYNGDTYNQSISGLSISSLEFYTLEFDDMIALASGENDLVVSISNVNGMGMDDDSSDDSKILGLDPVTPAPNKIILCEEATGTWCQFCPRGAVMMDRMADGYDGYFAGVAVHNGDPMTFDAYDSGLGLMPGFSGYPGATVERNTMIDPLGIESQFLEFIQIPPAATILNGAEVDLENGIINVSLTTTFLEDSDGDWKIACILSEDGVTGTESGYNQSNNYSGGGSGEMGGYEDLPNPVPAAQMVYDHVGRLISPSFEGLPNAFPSVITAGSSYTHTFALPFEEDWNLDNMHVIGAVIQPDGIVNNASYGSLDDAIDTGLTEGTEVVGIAELIGPDDFMTLYPNPAENLINIRLINALQGELTIEIFNSKGQLVKRELINSQKNSLDFEIEISDLNSGIYILNVSDSKNSMTKRFTKK